MRFPLAILSAVTLLIVLPAPPAPAAPPAPSRAQLAAATAHLPDNDPSNEELGRLLDEVAAAAAGRITLGSAGTTNERRPIRRATLGHGPLRICYVTQQHGDEPLGTPAALKALWALGAEDTEFTRWLRSKVTLDFVVRANPDGQARKWRYNYDPEARPTYGQAGKGYDMNRYHDPATAPEKNPVPEAAAIQRLWLETKPSIVVDYHMQGAYTGPDGRAVTASILWPTQRDVPTAVRDHGKQLAVLTHSTMTAGGANVTRYPGDTLAGIARNAYGLRGSGSLLVELSRIRGREAFQIQSALDSMVAIARSAADGSLEQIDPAKADAIPGRGRHAASADEPAH